MTDMTDASSFRVLVVGGAGYIGSHVTKALLKFGHQPVVFDNLQTGLRENLFPDVPFIHGDILLPDQINKACADNIDAVVHLAALKAAGKSMDVPDEYAIHNITGSINLLNAVVAAGIDKFVFSSSAAVYGEPVYLPMDEDHPTEPINFYGHTKREVEKLMEWYDQLKGMRFASLRYFNAAGYDIDGEINGLEQNPENLLPIVMEAITGMRDSVQIYGDDYDTHDGSCVRDYIHLTDLADAHVLALEYLDREDKSLTVNLGTSSGLSVMEVIKAAKDVSGIDFKVNIGPRRPGDPATLLAKVDKASTVLGWQAKHSDANTLIKTMLHAYKAN